MNRSPVVLALVLVLGGCFRQATSSSPTPPPRPERVAAGSVPVPVFADAERVPRLKAALPGIERSFRAWVERNHMPGAVLGVIIDGDLVGVYTAGVQDVKTNSPVTPETMFRIASMTKSFTTLAVLRLRDEGRLSLDDPVAQYIPELRGLAYPTGDSPVLTIRNLLTHSEGWPEDNPWGDRQLGRSDSTINAWMRAGIPFSNAPGLAYEYSNFGFAILGQIVQRVSGMPYDEYLRTRIIEPLHLPSTTLHLDRVPPERQAHGYRWTGQWEEEQPLEHGSFGAMGGLWTSIFDLARYTAFHMSAWPPRDEAESGPVRRSSLREMAQPWRASPASASRSTLDAPLSLNSGGYGYGLRVSQACTIAQVVGHGGGLPGYGSLMRWFPQHGVGFVAMGNVTYASFSGLFDEAAAALDATGAFQPRVVQPGPELVRAATDVSRLVTQWSDSLAQRIAADNLFLDQTAAAWRSRLELLGRRHGTCTAKDARINAENALRGTWRMSCTQGWLDVSITLAPTRPAAVQYLNVQSVLPADAALRAMLERAVALVNQPWNAEAASPLIAPSLDSNHVRKQVQLAQLQYGACRLGDQVSGDGNRSAEVRLVCDAGPLSLRVTTDAARQQFTRFDLGPAREQACVR